MTSLTPLLGEILRQHDVPREAEGEWLRLGPEGPRAQAWVGSVHDAPGQHSVQLDVCLELWAGRTLVESCGGFGSTREEAAQDAMKNFVMGALHVLLSAFVRPSDVQVSQAEWTIAGVSRKVTLGTMLGRGAELPEEVSQAWADAIADTIEALPLATGTHWVRIYYFQQPHGPDTLEVLLDNEEWPELAQALRRFAWPQSLGFFSRRVFLVIQGGADVSRALASFIDPPHREDDVILEEIRQQGTTTLQTELLFLYVPMAFGVFVGRKLGAHVPEEALLVREDKSEHKVALAEDALWRECARLATRTLEGQSLTNEQYLAVASRSAIFQTLNDALHQGLDVSAGVVSPSVIWLSPEAEAEFDRQHPSAPAPSPPRTPPPVDPPPARKPWWKFW